MVGLKTNMQKPKVMFKSMGREQRFAIGSEVLEVVREYIFLGQVVTADPNHETEVTRRMTLGRSALVRHSLIMNSSLRVSLKRKVYNSYILQVVTHGAETWRLTKQVQLKLKTTLRALEKKMIGVTLRDKKRADWVREQVRVNGILVATKIKKLSWAWHVM